MGNPWTALLFLHGHIADPQLARRLAAAELDRPRGGGKRQRPPSLIVAPRTEPATTPGGLIRPAAVTG